MAIDKDRDTEGHGEGHRLTGRGTQTDRERNMVTDWQGEIGLDTGGQR
jgi:hypothetical protein